MEPAGAGTPPKPPTRIETDPSNDLEAALELNAGATRVPVLFTVRQPDGEPAGYLRLAHGQGHYANRLLGCGGLHTRLITATGWRRIVITSTEPGEAPGYLCSFSFTAEGE